CDVVRADVIDVAGELERLLRLAVGVGAADAIHEPRGVLPADRKKIGTRRLLSLRLTWSLTPTSALGADGAGRHHDDHGRKKQCAHVEPLLKVGTIVIRYHRGRAVPRALRTARSPGPRRPACAGVRA